MKVDISGPAKAQVRGRRAWWRKHRDLKSAFAEELNEARAALRDPPAAEVFCYHRGKPVYRYLMKLTCPQFLSRSFLDGPAALGC